MQPVVVGIAGGSGAGKTTLGRLIGDRLGHGSVILPFDAYYRDQGHLAADDRADVNYDHPDSLDVALFVEHLGELRAGRQVPVPVYDFASHTRVGQPSHLAPEPLIFVDGILLLVFAEIRAQLDLAIYIDVSEPVRLARRLSRDVVERGRTPTSVRRQFAATVAPMHDRFVEPTRVHADLVLDGETDLDAEADEVLAFLADRHAIAGAAASAGAAS